MSVPAGAEMSTLPAPLSRWADDFFAAVERAGAFQHDVNAQLAPRQGGRVAVVNQAYAVTVDHQMIAIQRHLAGKRPVNGVAPGQMLGNLEVGRAVDDDHFKLIAASCFINCAQHIAADAAIAIDGNLDGHVGNSPDCVDCLLARIIVRPAHLLAQPGPDTKIQPPCGARSGKHQAVSARVFLAASITALVLNPNSLNRSAAGADAPKRSMPMICPQLPTNWCQYRLTPASTATRAVTSVGRTSLR